MTTQERARPYRHIDAALVRATAFPNVAGRISWPALDGEADVERWCAWLFDVWADRDVAEAVTVASPVLAARVAAVRRGHRPTPGQARRMALSLARYLVRMRSRATPFALFAGVAPARFGPDASVAWTRQPNRFRARADTVWLTGVIARLERCAALRRHLPLVMNDLAFVRGERLVVPWQPHAGDPSRTTAVEASVRCNRAVQTVMETASSPIQGDVLTEKLSAEIPDASVSTLEDVVGKLVACGALISSLRPPSTSTDGLAHVLDTLNSVDATAIREVAPLVEELAGIRAGLEASGGPAGGTGLQVTAERMRALSNVADQPLMLDLRLGCTLTLPLQVAAEAAHAAGVLLRLTPHPRGLPGWTDYHTSFLARYGVGALVPVRQLVDVTAGLGFPAHYAEPAQAGMAISGRDERLLALAQQASIDGVQEVIIDDDFVDAMALGDAGELRHAPHMALCAEVRAPTMAALTRGDFTLAVTGVGRTAVALAGRFIDVLPEADRERIIDLYDRLRCGVDGAISAQLSFPPCHPRIENVACSPRLLPGLLTMAEHRDGTPGRLPIGDLAVTADHNHLYLVSLSRRRIVEPSLTNAAARHTMPPLARFLFELPRARHAAVSAFSWGAAERLPFLPRLRYGRTALAPARWHIPAGTLPGPDAAWSAWRSALDVVRERLRLPDQVSVGDNDRVLRLSLDEPMDLTLLRAHLDKTGREAAVVEAPSVTELGWFAGRAHEIVVPLASTTPPAPAPTAVHLPGPLPVIRLEDDALPGSRVLFAKVYGHPDVFDTILTRYLPGLWAAWPEPPAWWFVRYQDPRPHLRLRLHLPGPRDYGTAAVRVGAWAADLRRRGLAGDLVLDTYHPETVRYGSGPSLAAAEGLFAADSTAVLAQLAARAAAQDVHPEAVTAASMVDLISALAGNVPAGMRWLIDHPGTGPAPAADRAMVRQAIRLTGPGQAALLAMPGGPRIAEAWRARRDAAAVYVECLAAEGSLRWTSACASLLHMHYVRAHGIDPDAEQRCHRAARSVALSWTARHHTKESPR